MKKILAANLLLLMTLVVTVFNTSSSADSLKGQAAPLVTEERNLAFTTQSITEAKSGKIYPDAITLPETIDIDLSQLNKAMAFAAMNHMVLNPGEYIGKTVKLRGIYSAYQDEDTGETMNQILVVDSAGCCEVIMKFTLTGEHSYPDDYPAIFSEIELVGLMSTVEYEGVDHPRLIVNEIKMIKSND